MAATRILRRIQSQAGDFYGTTQGNSSQYAGTIYKIEKSGRYSVLHVFSTTDGRFPISPLVQAADGYFYGTTNYGGQYGLGTIFRISSAGDFKLLYQFDGTRGKNPSGPLIQATDGNFYGVTADGGMLGFGIVFKMTPGGTVTVFYDFASGSSGSGTDGLQPEGGLVEASDGNFYGTLMAGGAYRTGTLYRLTPAAIFTKLHDFRIEIVSLPQCTLFSTPAETATRSPPTAGRISAG